MRIDEEALWSAMGLVNGPEMFATFNLTDNWEWKQRTEGDSDQIALARDGSWTKTSVPTEIFKDLLEAGRIQDPRIDDNEKAVQWVGEVDWLYRTQFTIDTLPHDGEKAVLVFEGLDTFASVYLNGTMILKAEVLLVLYGALM